MWDVSEYYSCMRSPVTPWHTFVYLWQRHHYPSPISSWATDFHYTLSQLLFIIYPQNNTLYSSLLSSQPRFSLVVRMSGVWWETCCESPGPESDWAWYDDTLTRICHVTTSIMSQWSLERGEEERPMNGRARTGARWALAWCEVCHCLYLPNQQSPLCHCPPPAVKMFECPHNTKLTRKWRQYTLFYTAPPHQAEHKWR